MMTDDGQVPAGEGRLTNCHDHEAKDL